MYILMGLVQIKTSVLGKKGKGRLSGHATPRAQPDPSPARTPAWGQTPKVSRASEVPHLGCDRKCSRERWHQ